MSTVSTSMASSSVADQVWEKTSIPKVVYYRSNGKYRLTLNFTSSKGSKPVRRTSQEQFSTAAEARDRSVSWRLSWEKGQHGTLPNEGASPEISGVDVLGSPSRPVPLQGKSLNSLATLNAVQERAFKKQRREGGTRKRAEWAQSKLPTPRDKRSLRRAQTKRDTKVGMNVSARKAYAKQRVSVLEARMQKHRSLIDNLRKKMVQDDISVLVADDGSDGKARASPADLDGASDTPPPVSTSATFSDAQRLRLTQQTMVTLEMLQRVHDRESLVLKKMGEAIRICEAVKTDDEPSRKRRVLKSLEEVFGEASLFRQGNTLETVAKKVVEDFGLDKQASTILSWYREFLGLDGRFRPDCRGVHKREKTRKVQEAHHDVTDMEPGSLNEQ